MSLRTLGLLSLTALLVGCPPGRGDDDDDDGSDFGGLDSNGDGRLDADDVAEGSAAGFLSLNFDQDGENADQAGDEALETSEVTLSPGFEAWSLDATFPSGIPDVSYRLNLRFENLGDPFPALATGAVTNASVSPSDGSWYAYGSDPGGQVEITASSPTEASGFFSGEATLDVLGQFEEPTGETIVLHGFAFNGAPLLIEMPGR